MNRLRFWIGFFLLLLMTESGSASHIVGGYVRYDCLGGISTSEAEYDVTVVLYRDVFRANPLAVFTPTIPLTIFTNGNFQVQDLNLFSTKFIADSIEDPCFVRIDSLQLEEGIYTGRIRLDRSEEHLLVYQRCCRNNSIDNLVRPTDDWGNTWTIEVPEFDLIGCNSSPDFVSNPPVAFCPGQPLNIDMSAIDSDGDSLVYSFCAPYTSPQFNPEPNPAQSPPYNFIAFQPPQSPTFPVPSNPALSINAQSGTLTGTPTTIGQYVVGFCIEEYRNGALLSTSRRDVQINTANCNPVILTAVQDQTLLCDGRTVEFQNNTPPVPGYNIKGYRWDFGDPTTLADTSRQTNPTYVYPDTGVYTITLTANPGLRCSSTVTTDFLVYEKLEPQIQYDGQLCEDDNTITFVAAGQYEDYATFQWDFGAFSNIQNSTNDTVKNVSYNGGGSRFEVQLVVEQDICSDTVREEVFLTPNPIANFSSNVQEGCAPFEVKFQDLSFVNGNAVYRWSFGDGDSAFVQNPSHSFENNGIYEVVLQLITTDQCKDTVTAKDTITGTKANSPNRVNFGIQPVEGCLPLEVNFIDSSFFLGNVNYFWDLDNNVLSTDTNPRYIYRDTGIFDVGLLIITEDTCADTLSLVKKNAIQVLPKPEAKLSLSDSILPIKEAEITIDGRQSQYYENSYILINGKEVGKSNYLEYQFEDTGRYSIQLILENEFECLDTATSDAYFYDEFEFVIPNIFTPNGDGVNDFFRVRACGVYEYQLEIFNRFGEKIHQSNSLKQGWDGRARERKVAAGVYFYKIVIKDFLGIYREYQGSVSLLYE